MFTENLALLVKSQEWQLTKEKDKTVFNGEYFNIFYFINRTSVAFKNLFKKGLKNNCCFTLLSMCSLESYFEI